MKYLKTIYSLQFPEVKETLTDLWESKPHYLYDKNYEKAQDGKEKEFLNQFVIWSRDVIDLNLVLYPHFYACAGSSEAIREAIWELKKDGKRLVLFKNDYEGYLAFAQSSKLDYIIIDKNDYISFDFQNNDSIFLSNPSSIDGCFWDRYEDFMSHMEANFPQVSIGIDLCYVGTTLNPAHKINLNYSNINYVFYSCSKVFGIYYHRIGGVLSKKPMSGLIGNMWFKNMFSLELATKLMKNFHSSYFSEKYQKHRQLVIEQLEKDLNIKTKPSDVFLLAISDNVIDEFKRDNISRICITPALDQKIKYINDNPLFFVESGLPESHELHLKFELYKKQVLSNGYKDSRFFSSLFHQVLELYNNAWNNQEFDVFIDLIARNAGTISYEENKEFCDWILHHIIQENNDNRLSKMASVLLVCVNKLIISDKTKLSLKYKENFKNIKTTNSHYAKIIRIL